MPMTFPFGAPFALALVLFSAAVGMAPGPAVAGGDCSYTITNLDFGTIDPAVGGTTTGTFTADCNGNSGKTFRVCPNFGDGSGGSTSGSPRFLIDGANQLQFNLYKDAARTQIWGSVLWGNPYTPPTIDFPIGGSGQGSAVRTIYAEIPSGQTGLASGTYVSTFSGGDASIEFRDKTNKTCAEMGAGDSVTFSVQATISDSCTVTANNLNFGSVGFLTGNIDETSSVNVTCTNGLPYDVGLDGGLSGATDPTIRIMTLSSENVTYGLYRDSARTLPWGDTIGTDTAAGTGTGSSQALTVYGRVPTQSTPTPGTYTDTIVVTVTF